MSGGEPAVWQAPMFNGLSLDPFWLEFAGLGAAGCHVAQAFVVAPVFIDCMEQSIIHYTQLIAWINPDLW